MTKVLSIGIKIVVLVILAIFGIVHYRGISVLQTQLVLLASFPISKHATHGTMHPWVLGV